MNLTCVAEAIKVDFTRAAELANSPVAAADIKVEILPKPHTRPQLLVGMQAVYVFMHGDKCLKVGKAGPKSFARYSSHHYGPHAPSTLAKSIIARQSELGVSDIAMEEVADWMFQELDRVGFLIPSTYGLLVLSLLEAFVQCRLQPRFEGAPRMEML
jgi:hypothetical protein